MSAPLMIFRSLTASGTGATATASVTASSVSSITVTNSGKGYNIPPIISIVGGNGYGASAVATVLNGQITKITVTGGGSDYTTIPLVTISNGSGDWQFGQGISNYLTGNDAIALNIKTALSVFWNDAFWNPTFGVNWINLLGGLNTEASILTQTRSIIANCYGVTAITSVDAEVNNSTRQLTLSYNVSTIYSSNVTSSTTISV